jgi:2-aminoadipate transaminase
MVELSQKYDVPILEDDCYVDLKYEGDTVASLHSLDDTGRVMYVASFSKIIAPGMRLGYMTAPKELMDVARSIKSGGSVNSFAAYAVHRYSTGHLDAHIEEINDIQRVKRDAMVSSLGENFGSAAEWSEPKGGLFVWLKMREGTDTQSIRDKVLDEFDVGYHPGPNFAPDGVSGKNYARLCFGYNSPDEIREGVAQLAKAFEKYGVLDG